MIRRKGHLNRVHLAIIGCLLGLPLATLAARATPARDLLAEYLTLTKTPAEMHELVSHILFVPLGALLVVICRMTLGIRMMGPFRSVLLAVAFQVTGIRLGLAFLLLVTVAMVALRPLLKQMHLPYYARVSFMLGTISGIITSAILVASWLHLDALQRVAFLPVVVLCLTGDGVARTINKEGFGTALWRGGMTALVAAVITLLTRLPHSTGMLMELPELLFLQLGLMVVISEFFDLRLLQNWGPSSKTDIETSGQRVDDNEEDGWDLDLGREEASAPSVVRLATLPSQPTLDSGTPDSEVADGYRIAVVRNRNNRHVISRLGTPSPEVYGRRTVQRVLNALRAEGFESRAFEADIKLTEKLKKYLASPEPDNPPRGLVFNMAYGLQGECRYTHVPAMLEMAGVPYTGANPLGHAISLDKVTTKVMMRDWGIPTPRYAVVSHLDAEAVDLRFPVIVKPRHESTSYGLQLVNRSDQLREAVHKVLTEYRQDALVEEFIDGREVCIGVLGNDPLEVLPIVELDFRGRCLSTMTWEDKYHKREDEPEKVCPARIDHATAERLREIAAATFRACSCRDYARVDIRIDRSGVPYVLEINSMASLGAGGSFVLAADTAGYGFEVLVHRIVDVAHTRYFGGPAPSRNEYPLPLEEVEVATAPTINAPLLAPEDGLRFA